MVLRSQGPLAVNSSEHLLLPPNYCKNTATMGGDENLGFNAKTGRSRAQKTSLKAATAASAARRAANQTPCRCTAQNVPPRMTRDQFFHSLNIQPPDTPIRPFVITSAQIVASSRQRPSRLYKRRAMESKAGLDPKDDNPFNVSHSLPLDAVMEAIDEAEKGLEFQQRIRALPSGPFNYRPSLEERIQTWRVTRRSPSPEPYTYADCTVEVYTESSDVSEDEPNSPSSPTSSYSSPSTSQKRKRSDEENEILGENKRLKDENFKLRTRLSEMEIRDEKREQELHMLNRTSHRYKRRFSRLSQKYKELKEFTKDILLHSIDIEQENKALSNQNTELRGQVESMQAKMSALKKELHRRRVTGDRFDSRLESRVVAAVSKLQKANLRVKKGRWGAEVRQAIRQLYIAGCPLSRIGTVISICARLLGIYLSDVPSVRSVSRIVLEGGVLSNIQLIDEFLKVEGQPRKF